MYGASRKIGRGGGGGSGGKRIVHAPPIGRPTPAGRASVGSGPRGRGAAASSSLQVEESFSLVRENPLNFGMAIKLAPDLVEEIKRVEAQGCKARIRFGAIAGENVIQVADKTFKFTWSREPGDLCDIYEECRSGDGGNGLLVESGGTWRKLNVERELDESTKNHLKRRSEEAELKLKSRKAIVLVHQNSAMKNQMKAFAACESNQWRNSKNRKEPPSKKLKSEPTTGGPPKSFYKSGLPSSTLSKGKPSVGSPLSSQPEQLGPSTAPIRSGDLVKEHIVISDSAASQNLNKVLSYEKDIANRRNSAISDKSKHNQNTEAKPADLKSLLISLLLEHHSTGMSLKALEKAIGDAMPNSTRKIEPILKQIANYLAPGKYHLKPGIEMESFNKLPHSGSSAETNRDHLTALPKFDQMHAQDSSIPMRTEANDEEQDELNPPPAHTADITEKTDTFRNSPENLSDKNASHRDEGMAGSSSDSGSDSDTQSSSSDSGSDGGSHSKNKSQSPVGSRGGSSSDGDSDASSSNKQASDEEVDIMSSDNDKESKLNLDNGHVDIGNLENEDHHVSDSIEIDIEKDFDSDEHGAEIVAPNHLFANKESEEPTEDIKPSSADDYEQQERRSYEKKAYDDGSDSMVNDGFEHGLSGNHGKSSKMNSKRRFDDKHSGERTHIKKRSNSKTSIEPVSGTINSLFGDSPCNSSPDRPLQSPDKQLIDLMGDRSTRNDTCYPDLQTGPSHPAQRSSETRVWTEAPSGEKPGKNNSLDRGVKYSERSLQNIEGLQIQKGVEDKHAAILESHNRKSDVTGVVKEAGSGSNSHTGYSPRDKNSNTADRSLVMNGQSGVLRREHSDLELGEFREPFHEETLISKKQFERKSSLKHLDNREPDADYWNSDFGAKTSNKIPADLGKLSPSNSDVSRPHHTNTRPPKAGMGWSASVEAYGETSQKIPANSTVEQNGPAQGVGVDPSATKHSKKQKPSKTGVSKGRRIDPSTGSEDSHQKKILSSAEDTNCPFTKFEKEEVELKGPIRDISQYKEYVKEYQEKYESYCSLNKILESYRDEFSKLGNALETYKGRDMKRYNDILGQMRTSFRLCGEKHKRQKHIFIVLHEELKRLKQMIKDYAASFKKG